MRCIEIKFHQILGFPDHITFIGIQVIPNGNLASSTPAAFQSPVRISANSGMSLSAAAKPSYHGHGNNNSSIVHTQENVEQQGQGDWLLSQKNRRQGFKTSYGGTPQGKLGGYTAL